MGILDIGRRWSPPTSVRDVVTSARGARITWRSLLPLTTTGTVVLALGALGYLGGWLLGWVELMVVAGGCLLALALAIPFVVGRLRLKVTRRLAPDRVTVGDPAVAELTVTNDTARAVGPRIVEDRVGERPMRIEVPGLGPAKHTEALYDLPTSRRGRIAIGPAIVAKADPLGLLRREVSQTSASTLWVHPVYATLPALPVGFAKDLEGPTTDTSPAGDVSFHTLREYQPGDDYRHIHWLSTARAGTTMVRHYVDNRRPQLAVLLDDRATSYLDDSFEVAVSVTASLGVSSTVHRQPVAVSFGTRSIVATRTAQRPDDVLDALTMVRAGTGGALPEAASQLLRREPGSSALVLVTGGIPTDELLATVQVAKRSGRVIVVRVWPTDRREAGALPRATLLDIDGLDAFQLAWGRLVR